MSLSQFAFVVLFCIGISTMLLLLFSLIGPRYTLRENLSAIVTGSVCTFLFLTVLTL